MISSLIILDNVKYYIKNNCIIIKEKKKERKNFNNKNYNNFNIDTDVYISSISLSYLIMLNDIKTTILKIDLSSKSIQLYSTAS